MDLLASGRPSPHPVVAGLCNCYFRQPLGVSCVQHRLARLPTIARECDRLGAYPFLALGTFLAYPRVFSERRSMAVSQTRVARTRIPFHELFVECSEHSLCFFLQILCGLGHSLAFGYHPYQDSLTRKK